MVEILSEDFSLGKAVKDHFMQTIKVVGRYAPHPLPQGTSIQTTIIWAEDGLEKGMSDPKRLSSLDYDNTVVEWLVKRGGRLDALGWDTLLRSSKLDIKLVPGNHFNMMQLPNVS